MMDQLSMILLLVVVLVVVALVLVLQRLSALRREMGFRVEKRVAEEEDRIREDTLRRSRFTLKGQVAEQVVPFLEEFAYNPSDARFIGSPIDYVIFDGYTDIKDGGADHVLTIVLADVKIGPRSRLTSTQRLIQEAVEAGRIKWETIHIGGGEADRRPPRGR